jgi:multidrug efflux pump subunit AcrA (membrane-fusion protein)
MPLMKLGLVLSRIVLVSLTAVFLAVTLQALADGPEQKDAPPKILKLPAQVEAAEQTQLYSGITGFVQSVPIDVGDRVQKGQVLAQLETPELEAELKQKEALAAQADAETQHVQLVVQQSAATLAATTAAVQEAEAGVKQAQAKVQFAKSGVDRASKLVANNLLDAQTLAEKVSDLDSARAALDAAEAKVQAVKASREAVVVNRGLAEANVKVATARHEAAKAEVERLRVLVRYARIVAPFDGIVTRRTCNLGALAGPAGPRDQPLFTVVRVDTVRVVVAVPERNVFQVKKGADAVVEIAALDGQQFKGKIARTAGALDPEKGTLRAEVELPNRDGKLLPGMTGTVIVTLPEP